MSDIRTDIMAHSIQQDRRHRRRPDGQRHRPCLRARRHSTCCSTTSSPTRIKAGARHHQRQHGAPGQPQAHHRGRTAGGARAHRAAPKLRRRSPTAISSSRRRPRTKTSSARSSPSSARRSKPDAILATNTSSISITRLAAVDRPAGEVHRHPFHEPGAADGAGRADPRHRHRRRDLRGRQGSSSPSSARPSRSPRISRPSSSTASCCR